MTISPLWDRLLHERMRRADIVSSYIRLLIVATGGLYVTYLEHRVWIFYGTYVMLVLTSLPFWGIFLPNNPRILKIYRIATAFIDAASISLNLYGISYVRGADFLLYTPLFNLYYIILIFNSFRLSPLMPVYTGFFSILGFSLALFFRDSLAANPFPHNSTIYLALMSPMQQQLKLMVLAMATFLMYMINRFYLDEMKKSIRSTIERMELDKDLSIARRVQRSFFPVTYTSKEIEVVTYFESARSVGGDCFDLIRMRDRRVGLFIADVSGHGVSSALISTVIKMILNELDPKLKVSPIGLMSYLDEYFHKNFPEHHLSAEYLLINPEQRRIELANAGHPLPIIVSQDKIPYFWPSYGAILGYEMYAETAESFHYEYTPGDRIILYTDGIVEASNPENELYGYDRLIATVQATRHLPLKQVRDAIMSDVFTFTQSREMTDDTALVILELK